MDHEIEHMKKRWLEARSKVEPGPVSMERLVGEARDRKKKRFLLHYGNIIVLAAILIIVVAFLYSLTPFHERLGKTSVLLMAGGLAMRIMIEIISSVRSLRIDVTNDALTATGDMLRYYGFRKQVHTPIAVLAVGIYTVGFYLLLPEFSDHVSQWHLVLMATGYIPIAAFLVWQTRRETSIEMRQLKNMVHYRTQLTLG